MLILGILCGILGKAKMMWVFFCFFSFCLRMFLFFHEMKNGEDEKEEDIMEESDGNNTHRWKPTNEEMRERGMES